MGDPLERKMILRRDETGEVLDAGGSPGQIDLGHDAPSLDPLGASEQDGTIDLESLGRDIA
jgi:hypothetical protein